MTGCTLHFLSRDPTSQQRRFSAICREVMMKSMRAHAWSVEYLVPGVATWRTRIAVHQADVKEEQNEIVGQVES